MWTVTVSSCVIIVCFCNLVCATPKPVSKAQDTVNYFASHVRLNYSVLDNIANGTNVLLYDAIFNLTNDGTEDVPDSGWTLYFCHIRMIHPGTIRPNGTELAETGLKVYHMNGCHHKVEPTAAFLGIPAGVTLTVPFNGIFSVVARSDIHPYWYVSASGAEARTIQNTADESLDFVSPFLEPQQYLRTGFDLLEPMSPLDRIRRYEMRNHQKAPKLVIPTPVSVVMSEDKEVNLGTGEWVVSIDSGDLMSEAEYLAEKLGTVVVPKEEAPEQLCIWLKLGQMSFETNNEEAYELRVNASENVITITGATPVAVFWGIQSLLSLKDRDGKVPEGDIQDFPRFIYRGMHFDISRNFFPKSTILRMVEVMSMYKMNKLHMHLTDDEGWRLEIPGLPELTEIGAKRCHDPSGDLCLLPQLGSGPGLATSGTGHLTVEDYKEILRYADDRHIQVIPEIDMPGHAHAAIKAMEMRYRKYINESEAKPTEFLLSDPEDESEYSSVQNFRDNAINPCMNSTYRFVDHVVREIKQMHSDIQPLLVFHFGGDEVAEGAWEESPICHAFEEATNITDLEFYFVQRVSEILHSQDLGMAGWEDSVLERANTPYDRDLFPNDKVYAYSWLNVWELPGAAGKAYSLANADYDVILSHCTHFYFSHAYEADPEEGGSYWAARYIDTLKVFSYMPDSVYDNAELSRYGQPFNKTIMCEEASDLVWRCVPLLPNKEQHIIGMQGQLWGEYVRTDSSLGDRVYPRILALAERAWHKAAWEDILDDTTARNEAKMADWELFANTLGHKELRRLDDLGIEYHLSPPGAQIEGDNIFKANAEFPGLPIIYSKDGGDTWVTYNDETNIAIPADSTVLVSLRSADNRRGSRVVTVTAPSFSTTEPSTGTGIINLASVTIFVIAALKVFLSWA